MFGLELIAACAPTVAPSTIREIIRIESKGNPLALNVNGTTLSRQPRNAADAAALARQYIRAGYTVDLGLMQVNSRNLPRLGYTIEDMFNPCKNIHAGSTILTEAYSRAKLFYPNDQAALRAALSAYNTGSFTLGFANGYVAKYVGAASDPVRLVRTPPPNRTRPAIASPNPYTATTVVFVRHQQKEIHMSQESQTQGTHNREPVISGNQDDAALPGVQVEYTADEAERNGAFEETAMSEADAWDSNADLAGDEHRTAVVIGGRAVPGAKE